MGNGVPTSVQLLYIGMAALIVAGLSEFVDDKDRFFTPDIGEITAFEWGVCIGIAFMGKNKQNNSTWIFLMVIIATKLINK